MTKPALSLEQANEFLERRHRLETEVHGWEDLAELADMQVTEVAERSVTLTTTVTEHNLNLRGFAHGGYLFSLCDIGSGTMVYSQGLDCVTLNSSINYLRGAQPGDVLTISVKAVHWGGKTIVNEVTITNQEGRAMVRATVTMFVMGELKA